MSIENPCFTLVDPKLFDENVTEKEDHKRKKEEEETEEEVFSNFIRQQQAKSTKYNTNFAINALLRYCREINEQRPTEFIPKIELNNLLCKFFMMVMVSL